MTSTTPILHFPLIQAAQAQKHVTHNEGLSMLDVLVQLSVIDDALSAPPAAPNLGDRYIVASGGSADWAGADGYIAAFEGSGWMLYPPRIGWVAYVESRSGLVNYTASGWTTVTAATDLPDIVSQWGINASADATNRLAVAAPSSLFNNEGAGHQMKINKASTADTAALMFQTNWSGRAEMGLVGDDAFAIKTSTDGTSWTTGLKIDAMSGALRAPSGGVRETALTPVILHLDTSAGNDSAEGTAAAPLATLQEALERIAALDHQGQDAEILLVDGAHGIGAGVSWPISVPGLKTLRIKSADGIAANATLDLGSVGLTLDHGDVEFQNISVTGGAVSDVAIRVQRPATLHLNNAVFSNPGQACVEAEGGNIQITGMTLNGSAASLVSARAGGRIDARGAAIALEAAPIFSVAAFTAEMLGLIDLEAASFTGTATGPRVNLSGNAVLNSAGLTLPGDTPGTVTTGAQLL